MSIILGIIIAILVIRYCVEAAADIFNLQSLSSRIPDEFVSIYDASSYQRMQDYTYATTRFGLLSSGMILGAQIVFILAGGYPLVDRWARFWEAGPLLTGGIFTLILFFFYQLVTLPASAYDTFVIEEKFGFNKMTPMLFVKDQLKGWILFVIFGGCAFFAVVFLFEQWGRNAWIICWMTMAIYQLFLMFIAPVVLMPLFNKFTPLEDGELKTEIELYAAKEQFQMKGIFVMDGSRRSTKSNAFFTGFGSNRRIVLFDTLIEAHSVPELVGVLAHEMGHYKKKHIFKMILFSLASSALMFYLLGVSLKHSGIFEAFGMEHLSVYASIFFFGYMYVPVASVLGVIGNVMSRKHEFEADRYAATTYNGNALVKAFKNLYRDNLVNLTPHPLKVFLKHSHPPILDRIKHIQAILS